MASLQDVYVAMHNNKEYTSKFLKPLLVGRVEPEVSKQVGWLYALCKHLYLNSE